MADEQTVSLPLPRRILMTTDAVGGVWQYSLDLARALNRAGVEVLLASMGPVPKERQIAQVSCLPGTTLAARDFALEWMAEPWEEVDQASDWLLSLARSFEPDLIHLNGYSAAALNWSAPVVTVAHSCVFSWWRAVHGCAPGTEWNEYRRRVTSGLRAADAVVAPSQFMARAIEAEYHVPTRKVSVIHNFSAAAVSETGHKEPFALAAGRFWDPAKNFALLASVADAAPWPVYVAGINQSASDVDLSTGALQPLGALPHAGLLGWMDRASVFMHPALYEPFGLAVLEAAQRGCCLILADIPSLRELWSEAAVFVNPRDGAAWAAAFERLVSDNQQRQNLASRARQRAAQFRESSTLGAYTKLYSDLLKSKTEAAA